MLEAIVFDFDGVIVDSEPLHYRAFLDAAGPHGIAFDYEQYLRRYVGFDDRDGLRAMFADRGLELPPDRLAELIEHKARAFERIVAAGVETLPGAVELIERAADALPIAICSGAVRSDIEAVFAGIAGGRLLARFRAIVTADDVHRSKPHPQSYALAAELLNVPPGGALAIEDTPAGLTSARTAGLRTLAVTGTHRADLLADAERIVPSLAEIELDDLRAWYGDASMR